MKPVNMVVELKIPDIPLFSVNAILDTGATTCCIDITSIPEKVVEPNTFIVNFSGINSQTTADKKLKGGYMKIGEHTYRIPYTYSFPMKIGGGIQMILGCNFIRSTYGGIRIEGNEVTFYKNITTVQTQQETSTVATLEELNLEEEEYYYIKESVCTGQISNLQFQAKFNDTIHNLKQTGIIEFVSVSLKFSCEALSS